jgi:hypothetical protein
VVTSTRKKGALTLEILIGVGHGQDQAAAPTQSLKGTCFRTASDKVEHRTASVTSSSKRCFWYSITL